MPLLIYLPFIIWSGLFGALADPARVPVKANSNANKKD
jgi:hypothetical protein